ncbi:MAG: FUSC family protein [Candidatus Eremiobacterota bacterium]
MSNNRDRLRHAVRMAVGCLLALLLARWMGIGGQWVVITVAVVMSSEPRFGGILRKSSQRFWGTMLGAALAVAVLALFEEHRDIGLVLAFAGVMTFGYLAADTERSYIGVLGTITVVMILMEPTQNFEFAGARVLEILLGLAVALVVSRFFLPTPVLPGFQRSVAGLLQDLASLAECADDQDTIEGRIVRQFGEQKRLALELPAEERTISREQVGRVITAERRIFRYVFILSQVSQDKPFLSAVAEALRALSRPGTTVAWPEGLAATDPVHSLCADHLLEACRSLAAELTAWVWPGVKPTRPGRSAPEP